MFENEIMVVENSAKKSKIDFKELYTRLISATIFLPLLLWVIFKGGFIYYIVVLFIAVLALVELQIMFDKKDQNSWSKNIFHAIALILICITAITMVYLRSIDKKLIFFLLCNTIVVDTSAFFFGKIFQGPKIFPKTSPGKTWTGFLGSLLCSFILGLILGIFSKNITILNMIGICLILNIGTILGDLFESKLKRLCGAKDSGLFLPGHGGVLDRIDSLLLNTLLVALYV